MFVELVDSLRCVRPHEDSWLVAVAERVEARHLLDGTLGCPVCTARYPVRDGVADFTDGATPRGADVTDGTAPSPDEAVRLAALLGLDDAPGLVVLAGACAAPLRLLREMVPATFLLVNAAPPADGPPVSVLRTAGVLPLAAGCARAVALDASNAALLAGAVASLRAGGRLVAPAALPLPDGVRELARDERQWVAERRAEAPVTPPQPLLRRV
jgi:uncharacterized protein YbaR (Trm112 family)